jgi:hypothetical protein
LNSVEGPITNKTTKPNYIAPTEVILYESLQEEEVAKIVGLEEAVLSFNISLSFDNSIII